MGKGNTLRFAFVLRGESDAELRSGGWRVKVNREDVYVYSRDLGNKLKASLHGDDAWRLAHTTEWERDPSNDWPGGHRNAP